MDFPSGNLALEPIGPAAIFLTWYTGLTALNSTCKHFLKVHFIFQQKFNVKLDYHFKRNAIECKH